ncbi:MAG: pantetheine-phosphate adenylyltransferase, partial [Bacteroidota bacterium]
LLRGIRNSLDLEYEKSIAAMNQTLAPEIETVFLFPSAQVAAINSTIVRELLKNNTNVSAFIPDRIKIS